MKTKTTYRTYVSTNAERASRWRNLKRMAVATVCALMAQSACLLAAEVATDQVDYSPGATANITGSGFAAGETVVLQVLHADGTPPTGEDHEPWSVVADADGAFTTSWHVCEDDCLGSTLQLIAAGQTSGEFAETFFTDAVFNIRLTAVTPLTGGCVRTQALSQIFLQVARTYLFTFTLVTNGPPTVCLAANPPLISFTLATNFGNNPILAFQSGPGSTIYTAIFDVPSNACANTVITFLCDTGLVRQVLSPGTNAPVRLTASAAPTCTSVISCPVPQVPPSIFCLTNVTRNSTNGLCGAVVVYPPPPASGSPTPVVRCFPPSGSFFDVGLTPVACTASNSAGTTNCTFFVNVRDVESPTITCPDDITLPPAPGQCSRAVSFLVGAADNCGGVTVACVPPSGSVFPLGSTTVLCTAQDSSANTASCTFVITVANSAPVITALTGPSGPLALGSAASVTVDFTDADSQAHTAVFDWDDGSSDTVPLGVAIGTATQSHTYAAAGVYTVAVTVSDPCTSTSQEFQFVVIFDPEGGFVTGGGWIQSPAGAYPADTNLTGRANFGFVSQYHVGANVPTGQTQFHFEVGDLNFHSADYEWLVVAGSKAQYKGTGTINGEGSYKFLLTARDGQAPGGGGLDKFRIKIWNEDGIVYDNVLGASDDIDNANPLAIEGGSIVIHK